MSFTTPRVGAIIVASALAVGVLSGCTPSAASSVTPGKAHTTSAPGTQNTEPSPTATVPAPGGGTVTETVAPATPGPTTSAAIDAPAELSNGVEVTIASAKQLEVTAQTPGEISGPAVSVVLKVRNGTDEAIDLSTAMISLTGSNEAMGQPTTSEPYSPFSGEVAPDDTATGTYVFLLPEDERDALSITVEYVAGAPIALFTGDISKETR